MKKKIAVTAFGLLLALYGFSIPTSDEGKAIFSGRCASCHNVNKVIVGPALAGVAERYTEDWIIRFINSSQTVIKGGDKTAIALYEKFNKTPMPDHPDLTAANIRGILAYIKSETKAVSLNPVFRPESLRPSYTPLSAKDSSFFTAYLVIVVLMAAVLLALVRVKEIQRKEK